MQIKEIQIEKIKPNPLQPREYFDREKIKELADSIKEVGLVNPIIVRPKNGSYEIVAGERRWKACQVAGIKIMPVIVKDVDDGKLMIESLIENIHREDLSDVEKAKALKIIMEKEEIKNLTKLSKLVGLSNTAIADIIDSAGMREELEGPSKKVSQFVIAETRGLPKEERKKVIEKAAREELGGRKVRKMVSAIKKASEPVKKALFEEEKITPEIAEEITEARLDEKQQKEVIEDIKEDRATIKQAISKAVVEKALSKKGKRIEDYRIDVEEAIKEIEENSRFLAVDLRKPGFIESVASVRIGEIKQMCFSLALLHQSIHWFFKELGDKGEEYLKMVKGAQDKSDLEEKN